MKKLLSLCLLLMLAVVPALAEAPAAEVFVSITDDTGALVLACVPVSVTDADADGVLTLNDALICAHAAHHPSDADGYLAEESEFGMSMYRLWGVENGGSYGYCVNDVSAMNPLATIAAGDHVKAYAFTDLTGFTDLYGFFQTPHLTAKVGDPVEMTLSANGFGESWAPVVLPVEGAVLTVNGVEAALTTDAKGQAILVFAEAGVYTVSARCDGMTLVAPVCILTVE